MGIACALSAQKNGETFGGPGIGLEYGGIGFRGSMYPSNNFGIFFGAGYVFEGLGYNVGTQIVFGSNTRANTRWFIQGMYGYNAVILGEAGGKIFYGPSLGTGVNVRSNKKNLWHFAVNYPFRSEELKNTRGAGKLPPVAISVGYNFYFKQ